MQNILIISNESQSQALVDYFQPLVRAQINLVADFDQGLKEVFDKRPVAVFIQSEIAGISGDAVAKHIKGLLREDSPHLVLLRDAPDRPTASRHAFDDSIDLFLPLEEVLHLTQGQLQKIAGVELLAADSPAAATETAPPDASETFVESPPQSDMQRPVPEPAAPAAPPQPAIARPAPQPVTKPAETPKAVPPRQQPSPSRPAAAPAAAGSPAAGTGARPAPPLEESVLLEAGFKARQTTSRTWLYLCILLALLLGGAFFYAPRWFYPGQEQAAPATPATTAKLPAGTGARPIPAMVPLNNRDASYGTTRPGWDRYLSPTLEYLVFREQGNLKALQVIGRDGGGVPEQTVTALLRDAFQAAGYTVKSTKEQDGYLMEEGTISGKGEILVYRRKAPGTIRAVVVTWP